MCTTTNPSTISMTSEMTIPAIISLDTEPFEATPGTGSIYTPLLRHLNDLQDDTFPVYVEVRHIKIQPGLFPHERCAHHWTDWSRFGDATCSYCGTLGWSPYFMAEGVFGDSTVRQMVHTWDAKEEQANHWEALARDLTNADWVARGLDVAVDNVAADGAL